MELVLTPISTVNQFTPVVPTWGSGLLKGHQRNLRGCEIINGRKKKKIHSFDRKICTHNKFRVEKSLGCSTKSRKV